MNLVIPTTDTLEVFIDGKHLKLVHWWCTVKKQVYRGGCGKCERERERHVWDRARAVYEPRAVLEEFGTILPEGATVRVHDSTADLRYFVLPRRPEGTEGWTEEELAGIVTRDSMIGVREAKRK